VTTRILRSLLLLPGLLISTGCSSMSSTDKGVLGGGAIGAGTGALIGSATGHAGAGAAIGAAVGGVSGGLIGNEMDENKKKTDAAIATVQAQQAAQAPVRGPLGLAEVAQMAQQGISDAVIISQIRATRSVYNLTPNDIAWLKSQNVSDPVVMEMQATASRVVPVAGPVYGRAYYNPDVVYVNPPPPVGVGFTYWGGRRW
jgi:outer membrane lipoprotein SlyB